MYAINLWVAFIFCQVLGETLTENQNYPLRLAGSKGFWGEDLVPTTPIDVELTVEKCFLGLKKKRTVIADANAPKRVAVEIIASSLEFMAASTQQRERKNGKGK